MLHIKEAIIVEGKYDKEKLKKITDAVIICTHGFELYRSRQLVQSIKNFAKSQGVIILTDSDSAGFRIRNYLRQCIGQDGTIKHAYIPTIKGKEKRKAAPGKEGILGVEGMDEETLKAVLSKVTQVTGSPSQPCARQVTKQDFYLDGISGKPDSAERRRRLAGALKLPLRLSSNALLEMINQTCGYDGYQAALHHINKLNETKKENPC